MTLQLNGTTGLTFNDGSLQPSAALGKNLIINGDMMIDQRNNGASATITTNGQYTVDRFQAQMSQASKYSVEQVGTSPAGFYYNLQATSAAATTVAAGDFFALEQRVEGFNALNLNWGSSLAETVTLSFWVKSSLTGTFTAGLRNGATNRSFPFTYTISNAATWEYKTITIPGDTTGTWAVTNTTSIRVNWSLGQGTNFTSSTNSGSTGAWQAGNFAGVNSAVNVVSTSGATFNITGVQLEANTAATPFENLQFGQKLVLCQRYFQVLSYAASTIAAIGATTSAAAALAHISYSQKRATPTVTLPPSSKTDGFSFLAASGAYPSTVGTNTADRISVNNARISGASYGGLGSGGSGSILFSTGAQVITISSEL